MINITEKIYSKVKAIMDTWSEADIYAISFFVYRNCSSVKVSGTFGINMATEPSAIVFEIFLR